MFRRIAVAVGDGDGVDGLVDVAAELALDGEADVLLVDVAECNVCCGAPDHSALHAYERNLLERLVEVLAGRGVRSRSEWRVTVSGRVAEHVLDAAAEFRADLLIVPGAPCGRFRGHSQRRLQRGTDCPVLVVPRPQSPQ